MPLTDLLPWNVGEAKKNKKQPAVPATAQPAPDRLPNRAGFVQGVPRGGFDEDAAASSTGAAQNTNRSDFLQELWEEYLRCPWSFASVNAIARTVTAGGLVMKWDADTGAFGQKQPDKPREVLAFEKLLAFTNPTQDIRQLCRNVVADLQVFADAYVEVVWFAGIPVALYNQDCPTTFPKTDAHGNVTQYVQVTEDGRRVTFRPEQIIHFTLDSARPSIFGVSPTHAAEESIVAWMYLHACEKEAARRGLPPNVHVDHPAGKPDTEITKWQEQYAVRNIGPANIGTPITTKGGGKVNELQTAKLTEILAAKKEARDEIVCSYGVPPAKLGIIESGNLGGGTGSDQNKTFVLDVIKPIANLIAEKLQYALAVKAFGIKGWHVEFPVADYRDDKVIADIQDQQVRLGAMTLNSLRADLGQPPVEGGDDAVLIARQDIVLWRDLVARSAASVAALGGGIPTYDEVAAPRAPGQPGPPPAAGTGPSKGLGGGPASKNAGPPKEHAAIAEAVVYYLREAGVFEHTEKLSTRQRVYNQLRKNFAPSALTWVLDHDVTRSWDGPLRVPASQIDRDDEDEWNAVIDRAKVARIKKRYRKTGKIRPSVLVRAPGNDKDIVVDGHHHALASMEMGHPVTAYVAHVTSSKGPWRTLSLRQHNTANKGSKAAHARESLPNRERISKEAAGYNPGNADPDVACGNCIMFHDQRCDTVAGDIDIDATCTQWEAKAKPASTGSAA